MLILIEEWMPASVAGMDSATNCNRPRNARRCKAGGST